MQPKTTDDDSFFVMEHPKTEEPNIETIHQQRRAEQHELAAIRADLHSLFIELEGVKGMPFISPDGGEEYRRRMADIEARTGEVRSRVEALETQCKT